MWLGSKLYHKGFLIGSITVVALLGSATGAIAFDFDHAIAWLLGIPDGRFLHHPQAVICCIVIFFSGWWIVKLVYRLRRGLK